MQESKTPLPMGSSVIPHGTEEQRDAIYKNRSTLFYLPCDLTVRSMSVVQTDKTVFRLQDDDSDLAYIVVVSFVGEDVNLTIRLPKKPAPKVCGGVVTLTLFVDGASSVGTRMTMTLARTSSPATILARGNFVVRAKITTPHNQQTHAEQERRRRRRNARQKRCKEEDEEEEEYVAPRPVVIIRSDRQLRRSKLAEDTCCDIVGHDDITFASINMEDIAYFLAALEGL